MTWRDVVIELQARGYCPTESRLRWALRNGAVPRPTMNTSGCFVFKEEHVQAFSAWLERTGHKIPVTP